MKDVYPLTATWTRTHVADIKRLVEAYKESVRDEDAPAGMFDAFGDKPDIVAAIIQKTDKLITLNGLMGFLVTFTSLAVGAGNTTEAKNES